MIQLNLDIVLIVYWRYLSHKFIFLWTFQLLDKTSPAYTDYELFENVF